MGRVWDGHLEASGLGSLARHLAALDIPDHDEGRFYESSLQEPGIEADVCEALCLWGFCAVSGLANRDRQNRRAVVIELANADIAVEVLGPGFPPIGASMDLQGEVIGGSDYGFAALVKGNPRYGRVGHLAHPGFHGDLRT